LFTAWSQYNGSLSYCGFEFLISDILYKDGQVNKVNYRIPEKKQPFIDNHKHELVFNVLFY
nr:hypothetical protein [Chitinophagaceae bacterium]